MFPKSSAKRAYGNIGRGLAPRRLLQLERSRVELIVVPLLSDELIMVTALDHASVVKADDDVGVADRGQAVRDDKGGAALHEGVHAALDLSLIHI